ncbi:MAG TPA: PepSY domain-containing protein [Cellulomonas sp.]
MNDDSTDRTAPVPPAQPAAQPAPAQPAPAQQAFAQQPPAPAPQAYAPAPGRTRRWWLVGGAAAGVLLLTGGVAAGVVLGRGETTVVVDRSALTGTTDGSGATGSGSGTTTDGTQATSGTSTGSTTTTSVPDWAAAWVDADDIELWGDTLAAASAAALDAAGTEAVVTSAEAGDDPTHTYEIEVTRQDGAEMDVYLDADFGVVATKTWHH